jgi:hypothetical protein
MIKMKLKDISKYFQAIQSKTPHKLKNRFRPSPLQENLVQINNIYQQIIQFPKYLTFFNLNRMQYALTT